MDTFLKDMQNSAGARAQERREIDAGSFDRTCPLRGEQVFKGSNLSAILE